MDLIWEKRKTWALRKETLILDPKIEDGRRGSHNYNNFILLLISMDVCIVLLPLRIRAKFLKFQIREFMLMATDDFLVYMTLSTFSCWRRSFRLVLQFCNVDPKKCQMISHFLRPPYLTKRLNKIPLCMTKQDFHQNMHLYIPSRRSRKSLILFRSFPT